MVMLKDDLSFQKLDPKPGKDVVPTGYQKLTTDGAPDKLVGSDMGDRVGFTDLKKDGNQIIKTGAGDDIFNFHGAESAKAGNVNGIVDFGAGNDSVYLAYQLSDYKFTMRSDGGIKIQYVGEDGKIDGGAVTFRNAENFIFKNIDDKTGTNYVSFTLSHEQLASKIDPNHTIFNPADHDIAGYSHDYFLL